MTLSSVECFDSLNLQRQSSLDDKCRYLLLKTVYFLLLFCFIVTLATAFLSSVTVSSVPERMLIKGRRGIQGKRLYKFFS